MQRNTDISPFPTCVSCEPVGRNTGALACAREFYKLRPDAVRNCLEALDQFQVQVSAGETKILGPVNVNWNETTRQAAVRGQPTGAIVAEALDEDGHGSVLIHSLEPTKVDSAHRLHLVVWFGDCGEHYIADVTVAVRVQWSGDYNEQIVDRLVPNDDGSVSPPQGQVRYVARAGSLNEGERIVLGGVSRMIVGTETVVWPAADPAPSLRNTEYTKLEFADGEHIAVPSDLEVTYVDFAG